MSRRICIIEDFIIPSLQNGKYGKLLEWVDEEQGIFQIYWSHQSCSKWNKKEFTVFIEWSLAKGKNQMEGNFFTNSKGRVRSALNKLKSKVIGLKSPDKKYRRYQLKDYKKNNKIDLKSKERKLKNYICEIGYNDQNVPERNILFENEQTEMDMTDQLSPSEFSFSLNCSLENEKQDMFDFNNETFQNIFSSSNFTDYQSNFPTVDELSDITFAEEKNQIENNENIQLIPIKENEWKETMELLETVDLSEIRKLMSEEY